jgi:outer membrane lipopolysaccharide assembly protein LptE/RlpB
MSGSFINDPQHWRGRAEEARTLADLMSDDMSKQMMLRIAPNTRRTQKTSMKTVSRLPDSVGTGNQGNRFHGLRLVKHRV